MAKTEEPATRDKGHKLP